MAMPVVHGATLQCSFGLAPGTSTLVVPPLKRVMIEGKPAANINDHQPPNILPFGLCSSIANPNTASLTASALGVLTPGACAPIVPGPWVPTAPTKIVGGAPILTDQAICVCAYGGVIKVGVGGAPRETVT